MEEKSHFEGKSPLRHLKAAREKGARVSHESHGLEASGHIIGGADAAKETATAILLIAILADALHLPKREVGILIGLFIIGFLVWKAGRSAALGWTRLEKINRLISEEKHEIETNREEEKAELTEMYRAKGFSGELLEKVIDVLMSDDNKLLGLMIEEEFGVSLESYEHPLKQALGCAVGVAIAGCAGGIGLAASDSWGLFLSSYIVVFAASYIMASIDRVRILNNIVWNLSILFASSMGTYFFCRFAIQEVLL